MAVNYRLEYATIRWLKQRGLTLKDLESHPQIDDVILLSRWRDEFWTQATKNERAFWSSQWDWAYHKQCPLKKKYLSKLEEITITVSDRHIKQLVKQATQRQRIQQLRKAQVS